MKQLPATLLPTLWEVRDLAPDLMQQHGVGDWTFQYDNARQRYGQCDWNKRVIGLSRHLVLLNSIEKTRDTILHEIAHALTPGHHHSVVWRAKAMELAFGLAV